MVVRIDPERVLEERNGNGYFPIPESMFSSEVSERVEGIYQPLRGRKEDFVGVLEERRRLSAESLVVLRYRGEVRIRLVNLAFREYVEVDVNSLFARNDEEDVFRRYRSGERIYWGSWRSAV